MSRSCVAPSCILISGDTVSSSLFGVGRLAVQAQLSASGPQPGVTWGVPGMVVLGVWPSSKRRSCACCHCQVERCGEIVMTLCERIQLASAMRSIPSTSALFVALLGAGPGGGSADFAIQVQLSGLFLLIDGPGGPCGNAPYRRATLLSTIGFGFGVCLRSMSAASPWLPPSPDASTMFPARGQKVPGAFCRWSSSAISY
eukprot:Skav216925  [mRNA]  locus=scaffold1838:356222:356821:- [translate_table: standard]